MISVPDRFSSGTVTATRPFSRRGRAVTMKERDVVGDAKEKGRRRRSDAPGPSVKPGRQAGDSF